MFLHSELGWDPLIGSDRESGCDTFFHSHWGQCPHLFRGVWVLGFGDVGLF